MKLLYIVIGISVIGIGVLVYFFFKTEGATVLNASGKPKDIAQTKTAIEELNSDRG